MPGRPRTKLRKLRELEIEAFDLLRRIRKLRPAQYAPETYAPDDTPSYVEVCERDDLACFWKDVHDDACALWMHLAFLADAIVERTEIKDPYRDHMPMINDDRPLDEIRSTAFADRSMVAQEQVNKNSVPSAQSR